MASRAPRRTSSLGEHKWSNYHQRRSHHELPGSATAMVESVSDGPVMTASHSSEDCGALAWAVHQLAGGVTLNRRPVTDVGTMRTKLSL